MLFYGVQGTPGVNGLGQLGSDYQAGDCGSGESVDYASCTSCCDGIYDPTADPDGNYDCRENCVTTYPSNVGSSSATSGGSSSSSGGGSSNAKSTGTNSNGSQPWYASIFGSVAQGVTTGLTKPGVPVPPAPWYATPAGMGGIAVGLIVLAVVLAKQ
jgi:hypothetical protein